MAGGEVRGRDRRDGAQPRGQAARRALVRRSSAVSASRCQQALTLAASRDQDDPLSDQFISLLYRAGLQPAELDAGLQRVERCVLRSRTWLRSAGGRSGIGGRAAAGGCGRRARPFSRTGALGVIRAGLPDRYRIDPRRGPALRGGLATPRQRRPAALAGLLRPGFPSARRRRCPRTLAALLDPPGCSTGGCQPAAMVSVDGRQGYLVRISAPRDAGRWEGGRAASRGCHRRRAWHLLRLTYRLADRHELCLELRGRQRAPAPRSPPRSGFDIPAGTRVVPGTRGGCSTRSTLLRRSRQASRSLAGNEGPWQARRRQAAFLSSIRARKR